MKRKMRLVLGVIALTVLVVFGAVYYCAVRHSYDWRIAFSAESVFGDGEILYEVKDENFYVRFCEGGNILSARKDVAFWVKNDVGGFPALSETNYIQAATVNGVMYIFGVTTRDGVEKIEVVNSRLKPFDGVVFNGKRVGERNALCFCLKISPKQLVALSASLSFVDESGCVVSELTPAQDTQQAALLYDIAANVSLYHSAEGDITEEALISKTKTKMNERFFLIRQPDGFAFKTFTEYLEICFYKDFALVTKEAETMEQLGITQTESYTTSYMVEYTESLLQLRG